ncbi:MAG TPA: class I SAM-dependent methyltransferase [Myxococcota bacterium]|nr:class I SAM-dependent methyltransferase [Myxococcota bacterium]
MAETWHSRAKVDEYLARVGGLPGRIAGEGALVEILPAAPVSVLDLGCGDGRLAGLVMAARETVGSVLAVDRSEPMLAAARARFAGDRRVSVLQRDLADPIAGLGSFDVIVSGFAIHHLEHARKQALFAEAARMLRPGGLFANLEVVECATELLQRRFYDAIGRPDGDPEDRLAPIEPQLAWMRDAGLRNVDCFWRWRGFALLAGEAPAPS